MLIGAVAAATSAATSAALQFKSSEYKVAGLWVDVGQLTALAGCAVELFDSGGHSGSQIAATCLVCLKVS